MSDTLRIEYDRQLANIRSLRTLYEERARCSAAEKENLVRQLDTKRTELETEMKKYATRKAIVECSLMVSTYVGLGISRRVWPRWKLNCKRPITV